jgi:hypothetical protein
MTVLVFIHGRSQESEPPIAQDPERLAGYVEAKRRSWLGGLANGLITAGQPPVDDSIALFPFYGNVFADAIRKYKERGGRTPDLELMESAGPEEAELTGVRSQALLQLAEALDFDPARELSYSDPKAGELVAAARTSNEELGFGDVLRVPILRAAMQFIGRKTGVPEVVIERFLDDVAYYLQLPEMRNTVLDVVKNDLTRKLPNGGDIVVVGHSLGSIVAYDLLTWLPGTYTVRQFVTAGSPLGLPVVQRHLLGAGGGKPRVPASVPDRAEGWLNAYDVLDVVALLHPIKGQFTEKRAGQLVDERTHNPGGPHSISDYLSDPDVAGPIGRALAF